MADVASRHETHSGQEFMTALAGGVHELDLIKGVIGTFDSMAGLDGSRRGADGHASRTLGNAAAGHLARVRRDTIDLAAGVNASDEKKQELRKVLEAVDLSSTPSQLDAARKKAISGFCGAWIIENQQALGLGKVVRISRPEKFLEEDEQWMENGLSARKRGWPGGYAKQLRPQGQPMPIVFQHILEERESVCGAQPDKVDLLIPAGATSAGIMIGATPAGGGTVFVRDYGQDEGGNNHFRLPRISIDGYVNQRGGDIRLSGYRTDEPIDLPETLARNRHSAGGVAEILGLFSLSRQADRATILKPMAKLTFGGEPIEPIRGNFRHPLSDIHYRIPQKLSYI